MKKPTGGRDRGDAGDCNSKRTAFGWRRRTPRSVFDMRRSSPLRALGNIHARRTLPKVPEGRERNFHSVTRAIAVTSPASRAFLPNAAGDDIAIQINTPLPEPGLQSLASNVGEPSVAANGDVVFSPETGTPRARWTAAERSSFSTVPRIYRSAQPSILLRSGCAIRAFDRYVIWLMQYSPKSGPQADNIQRLALATRQQLRDGHWAICRHYN